MFHKQNVPTNWAHSIFSSLCVYTSFNFNTNFMLHIYSHIQFNLTLSVTHIFSPILFSSSKLKISFNYRCENLWTYFIKWKNFFRFLLFFFFIWINFLIFSEIFNKWQHYCSTHVIVFSFFLFYLLFFSSSLSHPCSI